MTTLTNNDERVKGLTFADGYLHIDLLDGLRLSAPFKAEAGAEPASHSRLQETPPSFWDDMDDELAPMS